MSSYGSMVPVNNVAAITTPDARTIAIKPWDKSMFRVIEKAIIDSTIVNLHEIQEVSRNHVILDDNTSLPIGELYRDTFTAYINSHYLGR